MKNNGGFFGLLSEPSCGPCSSGQLFGLHTHTVFGLSVHRSSSPPQGVCLCPVLTEFLYCSTEKSALLLCQENEVNCQAPFPGLGPQLPIDQDNPLTDSQEEPINSPLQTKSLAPGVERKAGMNKGQHPIPIQEHSSYDLRRGSLQHHFKSQASERSLKRKATPAFCWTSG